MKQPTRNQKIKALERIVRAIFGRPEGKIEYKFFRGIMSPEIDIECDLDNAIKAISSFSMYDIETDFYVEGFMGEGWNPETAKKIKAPEGRVILTLYLQPRYWKENEKLKEEIKHLKKNQKK